MSFSDVSSAQADARVEEGVQEAARLRAEVASARAERDRERGDAGHREFELRQAGERARSEAEGAKAKGLDAMRGVLSEVREPLLDE